MTYDQLLTFEAIVNEGSFKAAAEKLAKTQPGLSTAIKKLEEEWGVTLFDRNSYRPVLTPDGETIYVKVMQALESLRSLERFSKELSLGMESKVTLAIDNLCPIESIKNTLEFVEKTQETDLQIAFDALEVPVKMVLEGLADIAVTPLILEEEKLEVFSFKKIQMIPVIHSSFKGNLDDLKRFPHIIIRSGILKESKHSFGVLDSGRKWIATSNHSRVELIRNGLGWGRAPLHMIQQDLDRGILKKINFPEVEHIELMLKIVRLKERPLGKMGRMIWQSLKMSSEGYGPTN
jgi:DNA-binding transcriptional LysR family regulator